MKNKVTIIIPVYNTEKRLLNSCLNSVLNQTHRNIEIILVDDGSVDDIRQLCDEFLTVDSRINVIHQKNSGVSVARNTGTVAATGDYIMYVDSDDVLAECAVEEGVSVIASENADFIFGELKSITAHDEFFKDRKHVKPEIEVFHSDKIDYVRHAFITQKYFKSLEKGGYVNRGPCARLVKASIAKETPFDPHLVLGEDVEWNMRLLSHCSTVCFVNSVWYGYMRYNTSSLHKYYGNRAELLEAYHAALYERNASYFKSHPTDYAINMAVSFMSLIRTEYLSHDCPLSDKERTKMIQSLLRKNPWKVLTQREMKKAFSLRYKVFITSFQNGYGIFFFKLWEKIFH